MNVLRIIVNQFANQPGRVFVSAMKVRIERANAFRYPDASPFSVREQLSRRARAGGWESSDFTHMDDTLRPGGIVSKVDLA